MNNFKIFKNFIIAFSALLTITSCSNNEEQDIKLVEKTTVEKYLRTFYNADFKMGKSVSTNSNINQSQLARFAEKDNILISEVFVENENRARGYVITDASTNEFLYFIDVDRINYRLTNFSNIDKTTVVFENINEMENYSITDEFDFITVVEKIDSNELVASRFFGWNNWKYTPCAGGKKIAVRTFSLVWVDVAIEVVRDVPCDMFISND